MYIENYTKQVKNILFFADLENRTLRTVSIRWNISIDENLEFRSVSGG